MVVECDTGLSIRSSKKESFDDVNISSLFPDLVSLFKKLEQQESNYTLIIIDNNGKEMKKSFSSKSNIIDEVEVEKIVLDIENSIESIDSLKYSKIYLTFQLPEKNYKIVMISVNEDFINKWEKIYQ